MALITTAKAGVQPPSPPAIEDAAKVDAALGLFSGAYTGCGRGGIGDRDDLLAGRAIKDAPLALEGRFCRWRTGMAVAKRELGRTGLQVTTLG